MSGLEERRARRILWERANINEEMSAVSLHTTCNSTSVTHDRACPTHTAQLRYLVLGLPEVFSHLSNVFVQLVSHSGLVVKRERLRAEVVGVEWQLRFTAAATLLPADQERRACRQRSERHEGGESAWAREDAGRRYFEHDLMGGQLDCCKEQFCKSREGDVITRF